MRILDMGVAATYALMCVAVVTAMNPYSAGVRALGTNADIRASNAVVAYIGLVDLVFLSTASPSQICGSMQQHSNSTVILGGVIGAYTCRPTPATPLGQFSVSFSLSGREETVEAWICAQ